jgi:hypothetical protein
MIFTKEDKELILSQYLAWVDEVCDDLGDKNYFYPEEIVEKVLQLVENKISMDEKLRERQSWKKSVGESGEVVFKIN